MWWFLLYLKDCGTLRERCLTLVTFALPVAVPLFFAVEKVHMAMHRSQNANNFKQIALAMHSYNDTYSRLPTHAAYDKNGKPMLSWRVAILPFLEEQKLYDQFHLDEPVGQPEQHSASRADSEMLRDAGAPWKTPPGHTFYRVFVSSPAVHPQAAFTKGVPTRIPGSIPDGTANTILVVEAAEAVPWTKPEDLEYDPNGPLPKLGDTPPAFSRLSLYLEK